jgi:hypothetical protein
MPIENSERVKFLNGIHLFSGLDEDQFLAVAEVLEEETYQAGKEIIKQGTEGNRLYLIWSGKVSVTRTDKEQPVAIFVIGDHFGEESMLSKHHRRSATITAVEKTILLVLTRENFTGLVKKAPNLKSNIAVTVNSYHLGRRVHFKWLQEDEVIYFLARKHPILLVPALTGPFILALVAIIGMFVTWLAPVPSSLVSHLMEILWYGAMILGLGAIGWGVWNGIDWGNDYYIVTDRRVVWVEKVVGIYESRQETPLSAVQRVNVETEFTGRVMDYGDLIIRTIVGSTLTLKNVNHPYQAAALIDQHWKRSKETSRKMEEQEMEKALRARLVEGQDKPAEIKGVVAKPKVKLDPYENQRGLANLFRLRFEHLTTVTYRKHVFVLFEQTWIPSLILFVLLIVLVYEGLSRGSTFATLFKLESGLLAFIWILLFIAAVLWWIYQYVDWSNDIFQVTPDQIMDIDKTPLGQVSSDIASLDNILSIEYQRIGILELLFNYGTVFITVGGGKEMHFDNVYNPSAVQEDIERRRIEKIAKKEQESIKAERERVADWFAAYYHNENQFRTTDALPGDQKPAENQPKNEVK